MRLIDADAMNEELFYKQVGGKVTGITGRLKICCKDL